MSLAQRSYEKELLDRDDIPFEEIRRTMKELNNINTILGGHNITCKGVDFFLKRKTNEDSLSIAEIGCGGGDNLRAIDKFLHRRRRTATLTGIDIKAECIQFAKQNASENATWIISDYAKVTWQTEKPDIIFSSLFCHHFTDEEMVDQLKWLARNSRMGFFINDLHRHPLAFYSIKLLTKMFSSSYLVKNDGPLSVRRGFKKADWIRLLREAGISHHKIKWHWAFRYLICVSNDEQ